ncbi:MAG: hypothetical protein M1834_006679 [Cirrosporium novae-zelandiae]|nr:MAG: hypothetical protein M1834_006679 [Cirrosporium novae-zelandiae]
MPAPEWELPRLKSTLRLGPKNSNERTPVFDVKFYPYDDSSKNTVFAVVAGHDYTVLQMTQRIKSKFFGGGMMTRQDNVLNSCVWSRDMETGDPLLCITGTGIPNASAKIKVLNVKSGEMVNILTGHGGDINDLIISPLSPSILISSSMDHTIRVWSLDPKHSSNPCILMCAGEGHKEGVLAVGIHDNGRYLLSGGLDSAVCLWTLPEFSPPAVINDELPVIHYPHFSTTAVHSNYVDCVQFHGDLVLSRCAEEHVIKLWRITSFPPKSPPDAQQTSTAHQFLETRSAFIPQTSGNTIPGYEILLQFETPNSGSFYMRFSLLRQPGLHPVLAFGTDGSKILMWDLCRLIEPEDGVMPWMRSKNPQGKLAIGRETSVASSTSGSIASGSAMGYGEESRAKKDGIVGNMITGKKGMVTDAFSLIPAHVSIVVPNVAFMARQVGWSVDGKWMVVVGDWGMVAIFHRW